MNGAVFYGTTLGFLSGIFIRSYLILSPFWLIFSLVFGAVLGFLGFYKSKNLKLIALGVFIFSCGLGMFRFLQSETLFENDSLDMYADEHITVQVKIIDEPDVRETTARLVGEVVSFEGEPLRSPSRILLTIPLYPKQYYGDILSVTGTLKKPKNFITDSGREFDYVSYLKNNRIRFEMLYPEIGLVSLHNGNPAMSFLFGTKSFFVEKIESLLPEPESSLLGGLLLGTKQSLGKKLQDDFRKVGIVHIVVLSGYNITLIAESFMKFLSFLPRTTGLSIGAFSIVLFALMTGASSTIIRASIMALIVIAGKFLGRRYDVGRALLLAAAGMTLHNPRVLAFDVSFQLSFLATIALVYGSPLFERYFLWITERWNLRSIVLSTIATQIFVLPYILYVMGNVSLVALPVNLLVLPFIPLTMFMGFISLVASIPFSFLALPFAYITHLLLSWTLSIVDIFSSFSFASLSIPSVPLVSVLLAYILFIYVFFKLKKLSQNKKPA